MSAGIREHRDDIGAGLIGSVALHVGLVVLAILAVPAVRDRVVVNSVPVTIVADAVPTAPEIAPGPPAESIPEPVEVAPPVEAAPPPPVPKPVPTPTPVKPKPTVTPKPRPTPPKPSPSLNLDELANDTSLQPRKRSQPTRPTQPTTPTARPGGTTVRGPLSAAGQADALAAIRERVIPNWPLNCGAANLDAVKPVIRLTLNADGRIVGKAEIVGAETSDARKALAAVEASNPFRGIPNIELIAGKPITLPFNAAKVCRDR